MVNMPSQFPPESKKKPGRHLEHCVPSLPVVNPGVHEQDPSELHEPLLQLQDVGAFAMVGFKQRPVPAIPWSQVSQFDGHGWHVGPKKPGAQVSHDVPLNPGWQRHVPEEVQTPDAEQAGVHAEDCIS